MRLRNPFLVALVVLWASAVEAAPIVITLDTTTLADQTAVLAFDFIDGGAPTNTISVDSLLTDAVLGASTAVGGVSGSLPGTVLLSDADLFNEYAIELTLGRSLSFIFDATANLPEDGSVPDSFSVFLLDAATSLPLFSTTDPTGADALLLFAVTGGNGSLSMFSAPGGEVSIGTGDPTAPVPEPATLALLLAGLLISARRYRARIPPGRG